MSVTTAEKYNTLIEKIPSVFEAGKAQGGGGDITQNPMYYMKVQSYQWRGQTFPEGYNFVLNVRDVPASMAAFLNATTGLKSVTLICDDEGSVDWSHLIRATTTEILDITNFKPTPTDISNWILACNNLVTILGTLDLSNCIKAQSAFNGATNLKDIEIKKKTIRISISFVQNSHLSSASIQSIIDGLADLTGSASQKVEFHSSIITGKLTDEQILQIASKNWTTE